MNVVHTSRTVALALLVGSGGCGPGSVGPLPPAEPEADADLTSASTGLRVPLQARPGEPLPGLTEEEVARFEAGKEEFEEEEKDTEIEVPQNLKEQVCAILDKHDDLRWDDAIHIVLDITQLDHVRGEKHKAKNKSGDFTDADEDGGDDGEIEP